MFAPIHLFVVVWQTWISPLMPDGPENFNTNMSAMTWSWIQAWLVCPSHHLALVVVFVSALLISFYASLIPSHCFWVYLCYLPLSGVLVWKYLCPFEFVMGKISVLSAPSASSELFCVICVESVSMSAIYLCHHTFEPHWIYFPGSQICIERGGGFWCLKASEVGILEVAQGFVLRGWSVAKSPKVSRSGAREEWIWGGV